MIYLFFMLLAATWWPVYPNQLHTQMSLDDLRKVFHVDSHSKVPEYEVVHIRSLSKREVNHDADARQVTMSAFGRQVTLNLKKNHDFHERLKDLKVFSAESTPSGLKYSQVPIQQDDSTKIGTAFHDKENMAAVLLRHDTRGNLEVDGTLGNDLVISPLPASLQPKDETYFDVGDADDEMFLDEDEALELQKNASRKSASAGSHVVFRKKSAPDAQSDFLPLEAALKGNRTKRHRIQKRAAPDTVWPEVLLIVDYDTYVLHGRSHQEIKRYFISFWNGVDLRYKLLSSPRVKISLAGMIVAKDRDATPYLERNRLRSPNDDAIDVAGALTDMGKYLYREDRLPTYDLAVVITKLDMCRRHYEGGRCNRGTAGFAYVGGACVVNKRLEKVNSVAIIEDSGGFSGIIVAAHEVGHLLGCVHDGSPPPSYLGGPGATACPWEDGYIMSDLRHTERGFRWSSCSVQQFKHFLLGETATCLYNYPHENQLLARVLPGSMLSLDEQCRRDRGTTACFKDSRVCAQLFCYDSSSGYCVSYRPAAEGSPCGDGQTCRNGRCIAEIENIIPDYTHVTQSFANRVQPSARRRSDVAKDYYSTTPSPRRFSSRRTTFQRSLGHYSTASLPSVRSTSKPYSSKGTCEDGVSRIAGRMTCTEFLQQFGDRYCNHNYIRRNCCYSQSVMCV